MIYNMTVRQAEDFIGTLKPGYGLKVLFTSKGIREAEVTRINKHGKPVIRTWIQKRKQWSSERPLLVSDLLTYDQVREEELRRVWG